MMRRGRLFVQRGEIAGSRGEMLEGILGLGGLVCKNGHLKVGSDRRRQSVLCAASRMG